MPDIPHSGLRVYNTLTQTKEPFQTVQPGKVGMYVCGPTVYSPSHVGHMVGPVIFDTIKRYLTYKGYQVTWVVNITDVDDKLIVAAAQEGTTVKELAERVTADYLACLQALGVDGIDHMPRATEHIDGILAITRGLIERGFAYASQGDVYFDVTKAPDYGKLSHRDPEELLAGARIEPTAVKRHPADFALWKASKPGEPSWESPWGPGRPGWHIECSAMSMKLLGEHFDIHGGGLDLVFPHHENEVVQSESFTGRPFASYWLHNGLLTKGGKKISKSDPDTIVLMRDLLQQHDPDTLRALLLSSHYRRPIDYGPGRLDEIDRGLQDFRNYFERFGRIFQEDYFSLSPTLLQDDHFERKIESIIPLSDPPLRQLLDRVVEHRNRFMEAMDDDFNSGGALGELFEFLRALNRFIDETRMEYIHQPSTPGPERHAGLRESTVLLRELTHILGLFRAPAQAAVREEGLTVDLLRLLVRIRTQLREEKNFALADEIRNGLTALGVTLDDRRKETSQETTWKIGPKPK